MSDQTPPPPPEQPPRPRTRPPQSQARRRPPPSPRSSESKFIGYLVLGFGLIAVIAVLLLAFMGKNSGSGLDVAAPTGEQTQDITTTMTRRFTPPAAPAPAPKPEKVLHFKRQPNFKAAQMEGNWKGAIGMYTAVLQINDGVYQVILAATDRPAMPRFYSSGQYAVLEDILSFTPRVDWPPPTTNNQSISYQSITRAPFYMISAFYEGKMVWQNVPPDERRVLGFANPPLFMSESVDYVVWQKMD